MSREPRRIGTLGTVISTLLILALIAASGFVVYLSPCCDGEACLRVGIETENRVRMRRVVPGKQPRVRRLRFGVGGRRFRLIVESPPGPVWHLAGGVQLEMETDAD